MELTGNLKKQVEATAAKGEARGAIRKAGMELTDDELELVSGGAQRTVNTGSSRPATIRSGPGITFSQVDSCSNGKAVYTTGTSVRNDEDGVTWYEIYEPVYGWIRGSLIGY